MLIFMQEGVIGLNAKDSARLHKCHSPSWLTFNTTYEKMHYFFVEKQMSKWEMLLVIAQKVTFAVMSLFDRNVTCFRNCVFYFFTYLETSLYMTARVRSVISYVT